jgi:hypothetical protein
MLKPSLTPELKSRFAAYHKKNPTWGVLHVALDDGNIKDSDIQHCIGYAIGTGDKEGESLAAALLAMSRTQRGKLMRV